MLRKKKWIIGISIGLCLALALLVSLFQTRKGPLPDLTAVSRISYSRFLDPGTLHDIAPTYWPSLWDSLLPASYGPVPPNKSSDKFVVTLKDNSIITIHLYFLYEEPCAFGIGSCYFRGGSHRKLNEVIRATVPPYQEQTWVPVYSKP